jgi:hypothetical protein
MGERKSLTKTSLPANLCSLSAEGAEDLLYILRETVALIPVETVMQNLELLEPDRQPVAIGTILTPSRRFDQ